ncbi:Na(+)-translocating NADH-quinone reductase subunit A [Williamwhitmania taraxaci]|uniref:Na(+)-translocating NADH-quinone reductase subunit A n=1 Tax=Williamwhitmania taraxaci TaxID=1640674 RepID=A0A1G6KC09_9BACT|nr:Na(+)-translocating NADH-quinone reductase subunit A [Williamwhitmania taraxaci]SDC28530.1 Na+-transporting NADH:ubiquinone oxidoreductase subunit A [Williamwhitmania taraxaci]
MSKVIKIRKGLNIKLAGKAEKVLETLDLSSTYAVKPTDFPGLVPKLLVKPDDKVKAGTPLFYDKNRPEVMFSSPVSGTVKSVNRGERRAILEVVVESDGSQDFEQFEVGNFESLSREQIKALLLKSGTWPSIVQRPYAIIANPSDTPKAIFISGWDTAPLASDYDFATTGEETALQKGIDVLRKLTDGLVHLTVASDNAANSILNKINGVELHHISGPHPAGNVGVQIHHIAPINKGEIVWTLDPWSVIIIGRLFLKGTYDAQKVIALAGSEVLKPRYFRIISGASIEKLIGGRVSDNANRCISGNVLTGEKISSRGYLGYYHNMVTVIPEGKHFEFLGWAAPGFNKFSASKTFLSSLLPKKSYRMDTNLNGGERAFVLTNQYDKVVPMDIYPVYLLKAVLAEDIEAMENLGLYEIAEEDFALCEYVCTSKIEVQSIVRKGIELMIKEMN